ncbi:HET-domain-containing protein [Lophiostoma macrostomum CBS 122681]|uniref:HET-domain-containing protein n=1 Tax=Lophiostoma macrostomum CBS 122681 TaxID=1314788 RepID=A0A6A6T7J9_9PLEO|nr:HET-domain-containing protein [Lophiostoma macrostomum CBS 122681]
MSSGSRYGYEWRHPRHSANLKRQSRFESMRLNINPRTTLAVSNPWSIGTMKMYLLDTTTLRLEHFVSNIPYYVILSHTWGEGEVTFDDIHKEYARDMPGYDKVRRCCQQAVADGFKYAWIDTCCIDKRSSAELSEAINSMYRYYNEAETCYAYLSDFKVAPRHSPYQAPLSFEESCWFRRGWTLQELVAPKAVEFYASDVQGNWRMIGTKHFAAGSHRTSDEHRQGLSPRYKKGEKG